MSSAPPSKRRATANEFCIRVTQPSTARTMIDMVHAVLPTSCTFEVQKDDDFEGLVVEEMDEKKCCIVHARLRCDVDLATNCSTSFALSLKDMSVCMRGVSGHYIMEMSKPKDSEEVHILSRDAVSDAKINACTLKTLCDDYSKASMKQMEYDYTVRIDLPVFRSIVKMAKDLGADKLEFKVYKKKEENGCIVFCLRADGNGSSSTTHYFPSSSTGSGEEGNVFSATNTSEDVDDLEDAEKWELAYSDMFGINYLTTFIRSMDRQVVTLRISPKQPLIILFPLGGDDSYVCYILAPKDDED